MEAVLNNLQKFTDPANLEKLVGGPADWDGPTALEISRRIIREENVIQRFVQAIRSLDSFVVGAVGGRIDFLDSLHQIFCCQVAFK